MNDLILLTVVAALVILDFIAGWWFGTKIKNYSLVDALWAAWIGLAGILYAILGSGDVPKRIAAGALAAIWGGRLAYHLQKRIRKHHPEEDSRYQKLREIWQGRETRSFFWFFQAQAISVLLLALPYFLIARSSKPSASPSPSSASPAKSWQTTKCHSLKNATTAPPRSARTASGTTPAIPTTFSKW